MANEEDKQRLRERLQQLSAGNQVFALPDAAEVSVLYPHEDETDEEFRRRAVEVCGVIVLEIGANGSPVVARALGQAKEREREDAGE